MRRLLVIIGSGVLVLALGLGAALMLVSADSYRAEIERVVSAQTGHTVRIAGTMRFTLDPSLAIEMNDVMLDAQGVPGQLAHAGRVVASVELMPLLTGDVRVTRLTLVGADIRVADPAGLVAGQGAPDPFAAMRFSDLHLVDSVIAIGPDIEFRADDLTLAWPAGDATLTARGRFTWANRTFEVEAAVADRTKLASGGTVPLRVAFQSPLGKGVVDGRMDLAAASFDGSLNMTAPSARRLAIFLGTQLPGDRGLGAMSLAAAVKLSPDHLMLTDAKFTLDAMTGGGMMDIARQGDRLALDGAVSVDQLDVTSYVTLEEPETAEDDGGWSEARVDLSSLATFDAKVQVMARRASMAGLRMEKVVAAVALKDGIADVDMNSATIHAGLARGRLRVDVTGEVPALGLSMQMLGFNAQGFFSDAVDSQAVTGRGDIALDLRSRGVSRKALVANLAGAVELRVTDGILNGADLGGIARTVLTRSAPGGIGDEEGTNFQSIEMKLTLLEGHADIRELSVIGPHLQTRVDGGFGLAARTMRVSVKPRAVGVHGGAGAATAGFAMPFAATGPWSAPTVVADWAGLAEMMERAEVSADELNALPESSRNWFLEQVKSGAPFPALPDVAGSEAPSGVQ